MKGQFVSFLLKTYTQLAKWSKNKKDFAGGFEAERFGRFGLWQGRLIFIGGDKRYAFGCGGELLFFIDEDSSDVVSGKHAFEISDPCVAVDDVCHGGCTDGDEVKQQADDEKRSEQPNYNGPCSGCGDGGSPGGHLCSNGLRIGVYPSYEWHPCKEQGHKDDKFYRRDVSAVLGGSG